ncbi:MAG: response regulator [Planctomycetes bacterium]|nr:response regulator [Planctomycetota bacterium]
MASAGAESRHGGAAIPRPAVRVLVIDDEEMIRALVEHVCLERMGLAVEALGSVGEGIAALAAARYDLVITDLQIGRDSGLAIMAHVAEHAAATPVIAMSGSWTESARGEMERLGCRALLDKPFGIAVLEAAVRSALGMLLPPAGSGAPAGAGMAPTPADLLAAPGGRAGAATGAGTARARRILIVDDARQVAGLVAEVLGAEGHSVAEAHSARAGFHRMAGEKFDLALFDIVMPGEDGLALLARMRTLGLVDDTPVIFLSAHATRENRRAAQALGAAGLLAKPFDVDALVAAVTDVLAGRPPASPQPAHLQAFAGDISMLPVTELCRLADLSGRAIVASLTADAAQGELVFERRGLIHARLERPGTPPVEGESALSELTGWRAGRFCIRHEEAARPVNITRPLAGLLDLAPGADAPPPSAP